MSHSVGQVVYNAGDVADTAYFVQSGTYIATRPSPAGPRKLREYGPGDSFGSCELLAGEPRSCNVSCIEAGQVWLVDKRVFMEKMRVTAPPKKELLEHVRASTAGSQPTTWPEREGGCSTPGIESLDARGGSVLWSW